MFVLKDEPGDWTQEKIEAAMNGGRPTTVVLKKPLPVIIFYTTVLVDTAGTASFYDDLYDHDEVLEGALAAGYPYPP